MNNREDGICYICGTWNYELDQHHLLIGRNRKNADEDGLYIYICRKCHNYIHSSKGCDKLYSLKQLGQKEYEKTHTRKEFIERYKVNYL